MARVLLISANLTLDPYPVYPLGMAVVAGALVHRGHQVEQCDFLHMGASEALLAARIRTFQPDVVGISLRNLDSCDSLAAQDYSIVARQLVAAVRRATACPVILGGPAFSILPEELLAFTGADHGVAGEGEACLAELVEALVEGRPAPPVSRSAHLLCSEEFSSPRYDPELVRFYVERSGLLNVQTKRGCPHHCIYCNYPALEGHAYRARDPEAVVDDLAELKARHGVSDFFFSDGVFNDTSDHHMKLVETLLRRALGVRWSCYMRPQHMRTEDLCLMKRAGLQAVELGTDAACDATLAALAKGFTFAEVLETNEAFVAATVPCAHFVMFGGPGETEDTVREGLANLARLRYTVVFAFTGIRIFPDTPLHTLALREGLLKPGATLREPIYYHAPHLDPQRLNALLEAGFKGQRDRFFPPERGRERMDVLRRMGYRGLLWDSLIRFPPTTSEVPPC